MSALTVCELAFNVISSSYKLTDRYSGVYSTAGTIPLLAGRPVAHKRTEVHVSAQSMLQGSTRHD